MDGSSAGTRPRPQRQVGFAQLDVRVGARMQLLAPRFGRGNPFSSLLIGWVDGEFLIVRRPLERGFAVPLPAGEHLVVRLFTGTEVTEFHSSVQRAFAAPLNYLHIEYPRAVRAWRLRAEQRVAADIAAEVEVEGQPAPVAVRIADLNTLGARVESPAALGSRGSKLMLRIPSDTEVPLSLVAEIRSVRASGGTDAAACVCGVQFDPLPPPQAAQLQSLMAVAADKERQRPATPEKPVPATVGEPG